MWHKIIKATWRGHKLNIKNALNDIPHTCSWREDKGKCRIWDVEAYSGSDGIDKNLRRGLSVNSPIIVIPPSNKRLPQGKLRTALTELKERTGCGRAIALHMPELGYATQETIDKIWKHLKEKCNWDLLETYELSDFKKKMKRGSAKCNGNVGVMPTRGGSRITKKFVDISDIGGVYCEGKYNSIDLFGIDDFSDTNCLFNELSAINDWLNVEQIYVVPKRFMKVAEENIKLVSVKDLVAVNKVNYDKRKCNRIAKINSKARVAKKASGIYTYLTPHLAEKIKELDKDSEFRLFFEKYIVGDKNLQREDDKYLTYMKALYNYENKAQEKTIAEIDKAIKNIRSKYILVGKADSYYYNRDKTLVDHLILYIKAVDSAS
jgi:hypothetical protein